MGRFSGKTCRLLVMFVLTMGFFFLEVVFGYITNSVALIADSFHMLSDVLALAIAFICMKASKMTRSERNTFGWVRAELLGALVNTVFLVALSFSIIMQAIQRFIKREYIQDPESILIVGSAGLLLNLVGLFLFHDHGGHSHSHGHSHGHSHANSIGNTSGSKSGCCSRILPKCLLSDQEKSSDQDSTSSTSSASKKDMSAGSQMNIRGVWLHVLGDAFGSVVIILNALVNWLTDVQFFKLYLDPMLSLVISGIIIATSIPLLKESSLVLLQTVPPQIDVFQLQQKMLTNFGHFITSIHEFHVWTLSGNKIVATIHVRCGGNAKSNLQLAIALKEFFHSEGIHATTIQLEPMQLDNSNLDQCALKCPISVDGDNRPCSIDTCCTTPSNSNLQAISSIYGENKINGDAFPNSIAL